MTSIPMTKWEHLTVVIRFNHQNGKIKNTVSNGITKEYQPEERPTIHEYIGTLGEDGWELVGIVGTDTYLFSRRS
jgi:hypothetical protein